MECVMSHIETPIPTLAFFSFLDEICLRTPKYYLFNDNAYRKLMYEDNLERFRDFVRDYYKPEKLHLLNREMTYKRFTALLRQICSSSVIPLESKTKHANSNYCIEYFVYHDDA